MAVFVLDCHQQPLMPCSEKRARLLLGRKRAVVHRLWPFTIRLKDRRREESQVQPVALKLDPGSKTTGMALVRVEDTQQGEMHHALHLADLSHRGQQVQHALRKRAGYRRRRRSANLRHRCPRFQNPELTGVAYQRGDLFGWEIRRYLLEKFRRRCVYCGRGETAFEIDHVVPRSRGGSDQVSNLVLSCHDCNSAKGDRTAAEFGHPQVAVQAKLPLRDAAAVNTTRFALVEALRVLGLPIGTWSGGRTRWNRERFGIEKAHCLDALCVGDVAGVHMPISRTLSISAQGRGSYQRTNVDQSGFPRGYLTREKRMRGFATGDLVRARVPEHLKTGGIHLGRVAVRASGSFRLGKSDGISAKYCQIVQRADGYSYALRKDVTSEAALPPFA